MECSSLSVQSKSSSITPHFVQYVEGSSGKTFSLQQLTKLVCRQFFRTFCCEVQRASIKNSREFFGIFQLLDLGPRDAFAARCQRSHPRDIPYRFIHSSKFLLLHIPLPNTQSNHDSQTVWPSIWSSMVCSKPRDAPIFYFKDHNKQGATPLEC